MLCTGEAANFACPFPRGSFDQGNPPEFCCVGGGGGSSGRSPFQADDVLPRNEDTAESKDYYLAPGAGRDVVRECGPSGARDVYANDLHKG